MSPPDTTSVPPDRALQVSLRQAAPIPLDAHFACAPGELLALVGPSGSGKSTLLRCIAGLHRAAAGSIRCGGLAWFDAAAGVDLPVQQRAVGFVFQHYALFPHMTALQNVMAGLSHLPAEQRAARAREWLERVHLSGLEQRRPGQLSGGQQQRVALARALAREPSVLLLDEPFSAVDQATRRKLQIELARLRESLGIPVVLVTHDLDEARVLADSLTILHRGSTLQSGPIDQVLSRPSSAAVARLIGLTNLFEATIAGAGPGGMLYLKWRNYVLEVRHNPGLLIGDAVQWVVPQEYVILHRRDRGSRGERENPVSGNIVELVPLGSVSIVTMAVDGDPAAPLSFTVASHVMRRHGFGVGAAIKVSLLGEGIHLMPRSALLP